MFTMLKYVRINFIQGSELLVKTTTKTLISYYLIGKQHLHIFNKMLELRLSITQTNKKKHQ